MIAGEAEDFLVKDFERSTLLLLLDLDVYFLTCFLPFASILGVAEPRESFDFGATTVRPLPDEAREGLLFGATGVVTFALP